MNITEEDYLAHYGILRKSGRYSWGSGADQSTRNKDFLATIAEMKKSGMSEVEISRGLGYVDDDGTTKHPSVAQLRAAKSIALNEQKNARILEAVKLKEKNMSNVAIGKQMGIPDTTVGTLLRAYESDKVNILQTTARMLKEEVDSKGLIDVSSGVEHYVGVSKTKLDAAIGVLREDGYVTHRVKFPQLGTSHMTEMRVLAPPGTEWKHVMQNQDKITQLDAVGRFSEDGGRSYLGISPPLNVDSKRIDVRYAEQGGSKEDGVIYVRPGVADVSLGGSSYAQVRIAVDGTHYLKGMAVYKDDLPKGVDLQFNTNKSTTGNKLDAMKKLSDDPENPFGSIVRQIKDDKENVVSAMNIVNKEGKWETWSESLSSQMLSKQAPKFAKERLDETYSKKKTDLDEIMALTNPAVRQKLLESFADGADSSAVHLKAAALPRTRNAVILPMDTLKDTEVYAPRFRDGERVVLIRHPHGGVFEIPELTVNNRNPQAKKAIGDAPDAIGINHKVAERLSGADFDGDTVLVIPNNKNQIRTSPALEGLKGFDPVRQYKLPDGQKFSGNKQQLMGDVSNLITDMTIQGAPHGDLARAVRHSMVVIDAEKHDLNYKASAQDNGITQLKQKYQGGGNKGASTIVSRAKSEVRVGERKGRSAALGGPVDKATGRKMYEYSGATYVNKAGKTVPKTFKSTKLAETDDAHTLVSKANTPIERIYADHSNRLKAMANEARKEAVNTKTTPYSESARKAYSTEVKSLEAAIRVAQMNRPLERQAQLFANANVSARRRANPDMDKDEIKKLNYLALEEARRRTGAKKSEIDLTDKHWEAIQAGALTNHQVKDILSNTDLDRVKELATPRAKPLMSSTNVAKAKRLAKSGLTQQEIADALGVGLTTLKKGLE